MISDSEGVGRGWTGQWFLFGNQSRTNRRVLDLTLCRKAMTMLRGLSATLRRKFETDISGRANPEQSH
jgi:hypothetical protein